MSTVCDSSPLIGLNAIGRLDLPRVLFRNVIVPPARRAGNTEFLLPAWIDVVSLPHPESAPVLLTLGPGETEAIGLSIQLRADRIILDDGAARSAAGKHGLRVIGVLGILLGAKQSGFISSISGDMDALIAASFRISPRVYRDLLIRAGEL